MGAPPERYPLKVLADFNGLFGDVLCLSHKDHSTDEAGNKVMLREGMLLTAYDQDADEKGQRDDLIASGVVEASPRNLACHGSKWVLRIDENGVRHQSDLSAA
jgi:hypothetical protein